MSDPFHGLIAVEEAGPTGMITLRAALADPALAPALEAALRDAVGQGIPLRRTVAHDTGRGVAWMSPDELLLWLPHAQAPAAAAALTAALEGHFVTLADVSDARAVFRLRGDRVREVLAKLCPVDTATLGPDEIRRTRAAQVAVAFWPEAPDAFTLVCFRSVASYVLDLLHAAAAPGTQLHAQPRG